MEILLKSGAILLILSLVLAWLLVAVKYLGLFATVFVNVRYLLSAHIDYILMAILNWLVYVVVSHAGGSDLMAYLIIAGSAVNPLLFIVMAIKPDIRKSPFSPFGMFSSASFIVTTAGYGWAAWTLLTN